MAYEFTDRFQKAVNDYLFLLEQHYPQKAILKLVGDRYSLSGVERTMLFRGIATRECCRKRMRKIRKKSLPASAVLHIDAYNVLLTIGSYLNGNKVFVAMDGLLRDASEIHGKAFRKILFDRTLILIFNYLEAARIKKTYFYLDRPVSQSGNLAKKINILMVLREFKGEASLHDSADYVLKRLEKGICVTSDSAIIDHTRVKVFDLARKTLEFHFSPDFSDLNNAAVKKKWIKTKS